MIAKDAKKDNIKRIIIQEHESLRDIQKQETISILENYQDLFIKKPGLAKVDGHTIRVTAECSLKKLIPITLPEEVDCQICELLGHGQIEPSNSDWAHPVICKA